ncbi:MAG: response regulator transcription factor [Anaerolineae bacterium]|nr:response regulator transcription factor [Anaerolineae bacterium]
MAKKIRVAILDDHQSIIDGYLYRLNQTPGIEVVATATFSTDMEQIITQQPVDVLLMDVQVPMSPDNPNPHPILNLIPQLRQTYPDLVVLVISMHADRALIKSVIAAGASGYILKEDRGTIRDLGNVLLTVARGGIYFSRQAHEQILDLAEEPLLTTRQLEVLSMFAALPDLTSTAVAAKLNITDSTVRNLLSGVYLRLGVHNRTAAIMKARQLGLLTPSASASDLSTNSTRQ